MHTHYIKKLFNLKGSIIKNSKFNKNNIIFELEMPIKEHICPNCSTPTTKIHDYYVRTIKDMPIQHKHVTIKYNQRRYECSSCKKSFSEENTFQHAKIIADCFHYVRYIVDAVNTLRKNVQSELPTSERKWFKNSRKLLLTRKCKIKDEEQLEQLEQLNYMLINFSEDLRTVHREKEAFLDIIHSDKSYSEKEKLFNEWVIHNLESDIEELASVAKIYQHWSIEIKHSLEFPYSNRATEGTNNKIKTLKRISFGMPNFIHFKARIMLLD